MGIEYDWDTWHISSGSLKELLAVRDDDGWELLTIVPYAWGKGYKLRSALLFFKKYKGKVVKA